tara:strand:- start:82 stop:684 length:603 start_codon:yes stop_codon:yes gene_type:complete
MTNEDCIDWSSNYKLKLADFKKKSDDKKSVIKGLEKRQCFSYVAYKIKWEENDGVGKRMVREIKLKTVFDRNKSFFDLTQAQKDGISQEVIDFLVLHEQGHFDLAEESRKKMEREISSRVKGKVFSVRDSDLEEESSDIEKFVSDVFVEIVKKEFEELHSRYDRRTNHGMNKPIQIEYNKRFKQLRQLRRREEKKLLRQK